MRDPGQMPLDRSSSTFRVNRGYKWSTGCAIGTHSGDFKHMVIRHDDACDAAGRMAGVETLGPTTLTPASVACVHPEMKLRPAPIAALCPPSLLETTPASSLKVADVPGCR